MTWPVRPREDEMSSNAIAGEQIYSEMMNEMLMLKLKDSSGPGNAEWIRPAMMVVRKQERLQKIPTEKDDPGIAVLLIGDCAATSRMSLESPYAVLSYNHVKAIPVQTCSVRLVVAVQSSLRFSFRFRRVRRRKV